MAMYLKIDGIPGECKDEGHKDWMEIASISAPLHRSIPQGARDKDRAGGNPTLGELVIVRSVDRGSVVLQEACAKGNFIEMAQVDFTKVANKKNEIYLTYKLKHVIVTSYNISGSSPSDRLPQEEITLNPYRIEWTYTVIDPETGMKKGQVTGEFDPKNIK